MTRANPADPAAYRWGQPGGSVWHAYVAPTNTRSKSLCGAALRRKTARDRPPAQGRICTKCKKRLAFDPRAAYDQPEEEGSVTSQQLKNAVRSVVEETTVEIDRRLTELAGDVEALTKALTDSIDSLRNRVDRLPGRDDLKSITASDTALAAAVTRNLNETVKGAKEELAQLLLQQQQQLHRHNEQVVHQLTAKPDHEAIAEHFARARQHLDNLASDQERQHAAETIEMARTANPVPEWYERAVNTRADDIPASVATRVVNGLRIARQELGGNAAVCDWIGSHEVYRLVYAENVRPGLIDQLATGDLTPNWATRRRFNLLEHILVAAGHLDPAGDPA